MMVELTVALSVGLKADQTVDMMEQRRVSRTVACLVVPKGEPKAGLTVALMADEKAVSSVASKVPWLVGR